MRDLEPDEVQMLEFEQNAPRRRGAKEELIRRELGMNPVRYHQRLNQLLDDPAAHAAYPSLVARLRRIRDRLR
ncbi:DUF3263 domain-containing protein [Corynebacterium poyangense]|uniref:DUF3263 domain-containing protein n=1 Tax=Corynebacterium poyangense TaxID=2684405 RepID=A0A7H0SRB1_9CORY|nr:DUF3263 domain-containing protein [Corynebacterium poyangense]MBZ8176518.1 DUF3263 domain-containing protein [Corynebacterium poyangense]QNQ91086.1 DUF3263 domain-containing protein [Corynebacterium poyangense]